MTDLTLNAFDQFFRDLNDKRAPFQWQRELLRRVTTEGWPRVIDLPTASGKTAVLEIAVFHVALEAALPPAERQASRRCFFVVDRRVIVDEAHERATRIAEKLQHAKDGVLGSVADRLRRIGGDDVPLATAILRGGVYREDAWIRNPAQPLIVVSTVDQVGSRLFFRGYGVSEYARPVHAGLVGNDAVIILDEVHLSEPFRQTLQTLARYRKRGWRERTDVPDRFAVVAMSATPGVKADFELPAADRDEKTNPILARRLGAHKRARLQPVETDEGDDPREPLAQACAESARQFLADDSKARVVAVVVNRVWTARRVFELLGDAADRADAVLLTGARTPD